MSSEALVSILNPRKLKRQHELHDIPEKEDSRLCDGSEIVF